MVYGDPAQPKPVRFSDEFPRETVNESSSIALQAENHLIVSAQRNRCSEEKKHRGYGIAAWKLDPGGQCW